MRTSLVFGKSLGSICAIHLASQAYALDLLGLILISPLASGARCVISEKTMPSAMLIRLDQVFAPNLVRISEVECPILVVHGTNDTLVPVENADALLATAKARTYYPPLFVAAGHNDIEATFKNVLIAYIQELTQFCLDRVQAHSGYETHILM